ncbi:MAG: hypothetical protein ACREDM_14230 [Methylocella sp.]
MSRGSRPHEQHSRSDPDGESLYPVVPEVERQHELAPRAGLAMYTLTGNYESGQVHVRDLLGRLAQRRGRIWWRFGFSFVRAAPSADSIWQILLIASEFGSRQAR